MGWFGCRLTGISDTIAQAGGKIRNELIIHKPPLQKKVLQEKGYGHKFLKSCDKGIFAQRGINS